MSAKHGVDLDLAGVTVSLFAGLTDRSDEFGEPFRVTLTREVAVSQTRGPTDRHVGVATDQNRNVGALSWPWRAGQRIEVNELAVILHV